MITRIIQYFSNLPNGKVVLWCYLIWYVNTVLHHFDASPSIWLNSVGISALIGFALMLSIGGNSQARTDKWQTFRLFAMPFGVSSFSSLIKGKDFILVFSPSAQELATGVALCTVFVTIVMALKKMRTATDS